VDDVTHTRLVSSRSARHPLPALFHKYAVRLLFANRMIGMTRGIGCPRVHGVRMAHLLD